MFVTLKRTWKLLDGNSRGKQVNVPTQPGRYEVERIPNPLFDHGDPWLVLKGTKIGMTEAFWRDWKNGEILDNPSHPNHGKPCDLGEFEIIIEE